MVLLSSLSIFLLCCIVALALKIIICTHPVHIFYTHFLSLWLILNYVNGSPDIEKLMMQIKNGYERCANLINVR
jgi:hypothetical protein